MRAFAAGVVGFLGTRVPMPLGWERTNYAGEPVSLTGGIGAAIGLLGGAACARPRIRTAALIAGSAAATAGYIDDHLESRFPTAKGLRGHLKLLRQGRVSTGALKIGIIGAGSGLAAAALSGPGRSAGDWLVRTAAIAGSANLINLLDLRPGRALKAAALSAALLTSPDTRPLMTATAGVIAGTATADLAGRTMLGDLGANTLGAIIGTGLAAHPQRRVRLGGAAAATALILLSERVSFSAVIDSSPVLSRIDRWGR